MAGENVYLFVFIVSFGVAHYAMILKCESATCESASLRVAGCESVNHEPNNLQVVSYQPSN